MIYNVKNTIIVFVLALIHLQSYAQDSLLSKKEADFKLKPKHLIAPTILIGSGIVLRNSQLKKEVYSYHSELLGDRYGFKGDEVMQYMPTGLAVSGKSLGFKSKHSFEQVCTNQIVSLTISGILGWVVKVSVNDKRPTLYGVRSFPSGHTSTAFNGATLLFLEYKDDSILYASSGYLIASATGFFRVSNNKHWVADVLAGAGIGMATAYIVHNWSPNLYQYVEKYLLKKKKNETVYVYPIAVDNNFGLGLRLNYK